MKNKSFLKKNNYKEDLSTSRSIFMMLFIFMLLGALIGRAVYIQIIDSGFLQSKGNERYLRTLNLPSFRGKIVDRNDKILAITNMTKDVIINPSEMDEDTKKQKKLLDLLGMNPNEFQNKVKVNKNFVYLRRQVDLEIIEKIKDLKFKGLILEDSQKRFYPTSEVASHLVGFINIDNKGQEGVELTKNDLLVGKNGERTVYKDRKGEIVGQIGNTIYPENGSDVKLTIDLDIQTAAKKYLGDALEKHAASAGSVVVLDAQTGEILALVNMPDYNPNTRANLDWKKLRNRALVDIFEPGSTMKPFSITLALDKNLVTENSMFDTSEVTVGNKTIHDTHPQGVLSVAGIIQKSSNIGTVKVAMQLKPEDMYDMFNSLSFGKVIDIGFPGESRGIVRNVKNWRPVEQANMAFGQGISVNLLQMAHAYQAFSNEGVVCDVSLYKIKEQERKCSRVYSSQNANKMKNMLQAVTEKGGTAEWAQAKYYNVAGKTGTANKVENGKYVNKYVSSFVGFAPVQNPKIIVAVMVDEPKKGSHYGGIVAAPVFANIVSDVLPKLGIPEEKNLDKLEKEKAENQVAKKIEVKLEETSQISASENAPIVIEKNNIQSNKEKIEQKNNEIKKSPKISGEVKENNYFVQLGAYKDVKQAEKIKTNLLKNNYNVTIQEIEQKNQKLYRVRVGPFDAIEAEIFNKKAQEQKYSPLIIKQ